MSLVSILLGSTATTGSLSAPAQTQLQVATATALQDADQLDKVSRDLGFARDNQEEEIKIRAMERPIDFLKEAMNAQQVYQQKVVDRYLEDKLYYLAQQFSEDEADKKAKENANAYKTKLKAIHQAKYPSNYITLAKTYSKTKP